MTRAARARPARSRSKGKARGTTLARAPSIDVERLAEVIYELEQSLQYQDLALSPRGRAALIAEAYRDAVDRGEPPDPRDIDRMVWMSAG